MDRTIVLPYEPPTSPILRRYREPRLGISQRRHLDSCIYISVPTAGYQLALGKLISFVLPPLSSRIPARCARDLSKHTTTTTNIDPAKIAMMRIWRYRLLLYLLIVLAHHQGRRPSVRARAPGKLNTSTDLGLLACVLLPSASPALCIFALRAQARSGVFRVDA